MVFETVGQFVYCETLLELAVSHGWIIFLNPPTQDVGALFGCVSIYVTYCDLYPESKWV